MTSTRRYVGLGWTCVVLVWVLLGHDSMAIGAEQEKCTTDKRITNGCNTYGFFETFKGELTPACAEHDICYYCGQSSGITRAQCDNSFYQAMLGICKGNLACEFHALLYYTGSSLFGDSYYMEVKLQICKRECIKQVIWKVSQKKSKQ